MASSGYQATEMWRDLIGILHEQVFEYPITALTRKF